MGGGVGVGMRGKHCVCVFWVGVGVRVRGKHSGWVGGWGGGRSVGEGKA